MSTLRAANIMKIRIHHSVGVVVVVVVGVVVVVIVGCVVVVLGW